MPGMTRSDVTRVVYRCLIDPAFRRKLAMRGADDARPLTIGLPGDQLSDVVTQVVAAGGASNVVFIDDSDGGDSVNMVVIRLQIEHVVAHTSADDMLPELCDQTLAVFAQRVKMDSADPGGLAYAFKVTRTDGADRGQAWLASA